MGRNKNGQYSKVVSYLLKDESGASDLELKLLIYVSAVIVLIVVLFLVLK